MKKFYFTFGCWEGFPYTNGWVEVHAHSREEAKKRFRSKFPDKNENTLNCSSVYDEERWAQMDPEHCWPGWKCYEVMKPVLTFCYSVPTEQDYQEIQDAGMPESVLADRIKMTVADECGNAGYVFLEKEKLTRLGKPYIESHTHMRWSQFLECWDITVSENDWYNDLARNPERTVHLKFREYDGRECAYIFFDAENKVYYARQVSSRENFARWMVLGQHPMDRFVDGHYPKPNTIFECDGELERVRYDDWNDVAAYSDTFNPNFTK